MTRPASVAVITLGCPKNEVDSDRMAALIHRSAFTLVDDPAEADVVILNTCAFIEPATEESIAQAFALTGEWRPARDGRCVIVAGCMVSRYGAELEAAMPEPDAFVPVADEGDIVRVIERLTGARSLTTPSAPGDTVLRTPPSDTSYLKVSEGCDRRCAYCTIPSIRGRFTSAPLGSLLDEARYLIGLGARELVLVGQDIARYGRGAGARDTDLAGLIEALDSLDGDFRIRLMYLQPDGVTDRLLQTIAASERTCRYLDIPLQHASAPVLAAMGRTGDARRHLELLGRIRSALPDVTLRTTVMAGFPGETQSDHDALEAFLADAGFDYVGVFAYSAEDGTRAAALPGQVPVAIRTERAQRLRDIADSVGFARAAARVGRIERALIEGIDEDGELVGRTCAQAPDVDGITFIECEDVHALVAGTLVDVRITDAVGYDVVGVPA